MRFLITVGEMRMLCRLKEARVVEPTAVMGMREPSPTVMPWE